MSAIEKTAAKSEPLPLHANGASRIAKTEKLQSNLIEIDEVIALIPAVDREMTNKIVTTLMDHLGSAAAARLWLVTKSPEFGIAPLEVIRAGKAAQVLALLESRWGSSPVYA